MINIYNNLYCLNCKADLKGNPIPQHSQHQYDNTHISKAVGIMGNGDIAKWECPLCGHTWDNKDVKDNSFKEEIIKDTKENNKAEKEDDDNQEET